ncbi:MAG: sigma-70 family RNA polymerase sigma factor [Bryobacteraceae bacterium]
MRVLALLAMAAPVESPDDGARTIAAAKAGDLAAFESLMRQHERLVLVTAVRLLGKLEDAQDASQEVFLRLYRNLGKMDAVRNVPGWLYRVTVNVCHDMTRKRPASVAVDEMPELASNGADPQQSAALAERRRALRMSLRFLSEKERVAMVLRDLEGLSTEEVARALGSSEATVRSQISKARIKVRAFMERYFRSNL